MLAAFLAAIFFAFNATCAKHSVVFLGPLRANLSRLVVGVLVLGLYPINVVGVSQDTFHHDRIDKNQRILQQV